VLITDRVGVVSYASPAVDTILGLTPEELLGRTPTELLDVEDLEEVQRVFAEVGAGAGRGTSNEFRVRHRDGSLRILNVVFNDMLDDPAVGGLVVNIRDVTNRRVAENLLAEQADLLEAIARCAPRRSRCRRSPR
jgi:PAS domain S-box-containing protein